MGLFRRQVLGFGQESLYVGLNSLNALAYGVGPSGLLSPKPPKAAYS